MAEYLKDSSALYLYKNRFVYTDESLNLTGTPDGSGRLNGGPRWTGDSLEALETWLEEGADENDREKVKSDVQDIGRDSQKPAEDEDERDHHSHDHKLQRAFSSFTIRRLHKKTPFKSGPSGLFKV